MALATHLTSHLRHFSVRSTYNHPKCRTRTILAAFYLTAALTLPFVPPVLATRRLRRDDGRVRYMAECVVRTRICDCLPFAFESRVPPE